MFHGHELACLFYDDQTGLLYRFHKYARSHVGSFPCLYRDHVVYFHVTKMCLYAFLSHHYRVGLKYVLENVIEVELYTTLFYLCLQIDDLGQLSCPPIALNCKCPGYKSM